MPRLFFRPSLAPAWLLAVFTFAAAALAQKELSPNTALYARTVRVEHAADALHNGRIVATVTAFTNTTHVDVYSSNDSGKSFSVIGTIQDPNFAGGLCCGTLFEMPRTVGRLEAGTLVWAGSVGQNVALTTRRMLIEVYTSKNEGRSWTFHSSITSPNSGGLWEPQFNLADDGALVMTYSDETQQPTYSQLLSHTRTYDGENWQESGPLVGSAVPADRPGMAVVNKLRDGSFLMTFELCGPAACTAFYKTSSDGWTYGSVTDTGSAIRTTEGQFFEHAPTNTVLPDGTILLVGQVLLNADGSTAAGNGETLFKNKSGLPTGAWSTIPAPVPVPGAYNNYCPNYSSPLLSLHDGARVLEFADLVDGNNCLMEFGTGPTR